MATLTTPNLHEAYRLFGYLSGESDSLDALIAHPSPVLIKNHIVGSLSADLLYFGRSKRIFTDDLIPSTDLHGTGCSYASAIAASLALGNSLEESIVRANVHHQRSGPHIGLVRPSTTKPEHRMRLKGLYAITDEILTPDATLPAQAEQALAAGVKILQYRNKTASDDDCEAVCIRLQNLCRRYGAIFIIDDRPELARRIGADGLHIGKDDITPHEARSISPKVHRGAYRKYTTRPPSGALLPITSLDRFLSEQPFPIVPIDTEQSP